MRAERRASQICSSVASGVRVAQVRLDRVVEEVGVLRHDPDRRRCRLASVTSRTSIPPTRTRPSVTS